MKERTPFILTKPYSGEYLEKLLQLVENNGLCLQNIYSTDRWRDVARRIYQKNIEKNGPEFGVGLEGHIRLVNYFFGNRAAVLLLESSKETKQDLSATLAAVQNVKRELRSIAPGGEKLEDVVVFMNLDRVGVQRPKSMPSPTGVIGIQETGNNKFKCISESQGYWDFYYFKYLHTPDSIEELHEELDILQEMGVLHKNNEIPFEDFLIMAKLRTLIPPREFRKLP